MFITFSLHHKSKRNLIMVIHVACNSLTCCTTSGLHFPPYSFTQTAIPMHIAVHSFHCSAYHLCRQYL